MGDPRPISAFLHGEHGDIVIIPRRIAALIESRLPVNQLRTTLRGRDIEGYAALMALHIAAMSWIDSVEHPTTTGTLTAPEREPERPWSHKTSSEAAQLLGITRRRVNAACETGQLPATKYGGRWTIAATDIEQYRARRSE